MNENINLCEILKNTPKGTKFYTPICGEVEFDIIMDVVPYPIRTTTNNNYYCFTKEGYYEAEGTPECLLFPSKDQRDWNKYHRPFKDGDILATNLGSVFYLNTRFNTEERYGCFVGISGSGSFHIREPFAYKECCGFATEEEKQKLFQAIKNEGYKWNAETKTLEKVKTCLNCKVFENMSQNCLYSPVWTCSDLNKAKSRLKDETNCEFWVEIQKTESLKGFATPCKFNAGDVIVSEHGNIVLFSHIDSKDFVHYHCIISTYGSFRIEENTNIGVGRYYDCVLANEQQKQRMYYRIKCSGYKYNQSINKLEKINPNFKVGDIIWNKNSYKVKITDINTEDGFYTYESSFAKGIGTITFIDQDDWELVEYRVGDHFIDPKNNNVFVITKIENNGNYNIESLGGLCYIFEMRKTDIDKYTKIHHWSPEWLKPFDKVLVRDTPHDFWVATLFSHIGSSKDFPYITSHTNTRYCIPYNSETEHLVGTTLEEPEFYKL